MRRSMTSRSRTAARRSHMSRGTAAYRPPRLARHRWRATPSQVARPPTAAPGPKSHSRRSMGISRERHAAGRRRQGGEQRDLHRISARRPSRSSDRACGRTRQCRIGGSGSRCPLSTRARRVDRGRLAAGRQRASTWSLRWLKSPATRGFPGDHPGLRPSSLTGVTHRCVRHSRAGAGPSIAATSSLAPRKRPIAPQARGETRNRQHWPDGL